MDNTYQSRGRHKWYLKCHLIFVCKYRKRLLEGRMQDIIKEILSAIELRSDFSIDIMETDNDHIHMLVSYPPNMPSHPLRDGSSRKAPVNCGNDTPIGFEGTSGKSTPSGAMDISSVRLVKRRLKRCASISRTKGDSTIIPTLAVKTADRFSHRG